MAFIIRIYHNARSSECQIINLIYFILVLVRSCRYYIRLTNGPFHRGSTIHTFTYTSRYSVVQSSSFCDIFFTSFLEVLLYFSYRILKHIWPLSPFGKKRTIRKRKLKWRRCEGLSYKQHNCNFAEPYENRYLPQDSDTNSYSYPACPNLSLTLLETRKHPTEINTESWNTDKANVFIYLLQIQGKLFLFNKMYFYATKH